MVQYEHIGTDPTPGDHVVTGSLADGLTGGHETLERVKFLLESVNEGEWFGETAIAFRSMLADDFRPKVADAEGAFRKAASALETWATHLESFRRDADSLDRRLGEAMAARDAAQAAYHNIPDGSRPPDDATEAEQQRYEQNERDRGNARETLEGAEQGVAGIWEEIHQLVREYDAASKTLLDEFDTAAAMAPDDPAWYERAIDWVGDRFEDLGDWVADIGDMILEWAAENAGLLNLISNILNVVALVTGILALLPIPGVQVLGLISLAATAGSTLASYLSAAGQAGSWADGFTPSVVVGIIATALGVGALGATFKATAAAATTAGRAAPTFGQFILGQGHQIPGFFSLAAKGGSIESVAELGWRSVDLMFDQGMWFGTTPIGLGMMGWDTKNDKNGTYDNQKGVTQ
ncbi:hypothetical protein GCM10027063_42620 [Promicromonospora xylanilytica]